MRARRPVTTPASGTAPPGPVLPALLTLVLLTLVMTGLVLAGLVLPGPGRAGSVTDGDGLPWPREGQAAVEIEGRGVLGVRGTRTPVPIASLAKVMTAYVVLEDHPLMGSRSGPLITIDATAERESSSPDESTVYVIRGRTYTQRQLLQLMLIRSGNNIARLLARWDAGGQAAFVAKMNRTAAALGMADTVYTGASGYEDTTRSTAADQLKLARAAMGNPVLRAIVATRETTVPGIPGMIVNTNTLLGTSGVIGLKTGSSTAAGGNLMWAARGGRRLILGVVLHQRAGSPPARGLGAALDASGRLVAAIQRDMGEPAGGRDGPGVRGVSGPAAGRPAAGRAG
ncbi:D-alanyl-D-alanine carboxypeptidase family protein [Streptosporangium sp. DT93]|uniref:D-alanyl-D-alanine carboxypeptidase family protein n=1 Tax=Streptosporangium sp. DT93 TaxID=3393428 RepID=UPI003CEB4E78